ncbi:hypothetical protein C8J57DRAFT_1310347, partial [Mycena rebaudengoi]
MVFSSFFGVFFGGWCGIIQFSLRGDWGGCRRPACDAALGTHTRCPVGGDASVFCERCAVCLRAPRLLCALHRPASLLCYRGPRRFVRLGRGSAYRRRLLLRMCSAPRGAVGCRLRAVSSTR